MSTAGVAGADLSTREQHPPRKTTSNICTNSGLSALAFTIHMSLLGEDGFRSGDAQPRAHRQLYDRLEAAGLNVLNDSFFNEIAIDVGKPAGPVVDALAGNGILAGAAIAAVA